MSATTDNTEKNEETKGLFSQLAGGVTDLFRNEIRLARAELREKFDSAVHAVISIMAGLFIALAGLVILLQALVAALADMMDPAWASLLVGVAAAIVALILVMGGAKALKRASHPPDKTMSEFKHDRDMVKEHVR